MEAVTLPIYNTQGKETGILKLNPAVFDGTVNKDAIYMAVNCYRANQRKGLAATKTRGEVSGGGRKPWKQKGTGRARVGSTRSPLWRHGGVVFGPHPRDFSYTIPKKISLLALKSSLNVKVKENNFILLDDMKLASAKTKEAANILRNLKISSANTKKPEKTLLLTDKLDNNAKLAFKNISSLQLDAARNANVYSVLSNKKLVITKDGLGELMKRFK